MKFLENINLNNNLINNVQDPLSAQDAATKNYVDSVDAGDIRMETLGSPTLGSIQDWKNYTQGSAVISGGIISDGGSGTIDVSSGTGCIRATNSPTSPIYFTEFSGLTGQALTDNAVNYVYINYNSGSPVIQVSTSDASINGRDVLGLGQVYRHGTNLHIFNGGLRGYELSKRVQSRFNAYGKVTLTSGGKVAETGSRYLTVTASVLWGGLTRLTTSGIDTSGADTFEYWRSDTTGWQHTDESQINNTQYDAGSGTLTALTNNRYRTDWVYITNDGTAVVLMGTNNSSTLLEAQQIDVPSSVPSIISDFSTLVARIIAQEGETNLTEIVNVSINNLMTSTVTNHNELAGLNVGDYQHLTSTEKTNVDNHLVSTSNPHSVDASQIEINEASAGATITDIQSIMDYSQANVVLDGCIVTDGGSGTFNISSGKILGRSNTAEDYSDLYTYDYAGASGQSLTDNSWNYIYLVCNMAGYPLILSVSTGKPTENSTIILIAKVYRLGTTLFIYDIATRSQANLMYTKQRLQATDKPIVYNLESIGMNTSMHLTITGLNAWFNTREINEPSFESNNMTFEYFNYWRTAASGYQFSSTAYAIDYTYYDSGSGNTATFSGGYKTDFVYVDIYGGFHVVYGQSYNSDYKVAREATPPTDLPDVFDSFAYLGKLVIQFTFPLLKDSVMITTQNLQELRELGDFKGDLDDITNGSTYVKSHNDLTDTLKSNYDDAYTHISNTSNPHSVTFAQLGSKPTTVSGFGITDAYTKTEVDNIVDDYLPLTGGTISSNLTISGNLTVNGTTTTINTETLQVSDNIIVLNNDVTGSPTENAGIEVERGTSSNVLIRWNETGDNWELTSDGSNYYDIIDSSVVTSTKISNWDSAYTHTSNTSNPHSVTATQISDFDTEVANNSTVTSNTSFRTTPSGVITAGTLISWSGNTLNVDNDLSNYSNTTSGFITASTSSLSNYTLSSSLSAVATSGSYNDLSNQPTLGSLSGDMDDITNGSTYVKTQNDFTDTLKSNYDSAYNHVSSSTNPHSVTFAQLGSKPTTLSGFGITDAYTETEVDNLIDDYLPLTGGTLSGTLNMGASANIDSNGNSDFTIYSDGNITVDIDTNADGGNNSFKVTHENKNETLLDVSETTFTITKSLVANASVNMMGESLFVYDSGGTAKLYLVDNFSENFRDGYLFEFSSEDFFLKREYSTPPSSQSNVTILSVDKDTDAVTFNNFPITPSSAPTTDYQVANKKYVDDNTIGDVIDDTTPELGGEMDCGEHTIGFTEKSNTSSSGTVTINWTQSNKQKITLSENTTFTFTAPSNPSNLLLRLIQDATGSRTITLPSGIKWSGGTAPTFSTDANAIDILTLYYDGSTYYGQAGIAFATSS